jgi:hypothetical protein
MCRWAGAIVLFLLCHAPLLAQTSLLLLPSAIAYNTAGDLFFVDTNHNQVFEVSLAGTLTTVAGTGVQGFGGDGASATSALLNTPQGIAIGPDNTIYVSDTGNQRIRAISNGQITTFAGTGVAGFSGDGTSPLAATLSTPTGLAIDAQGALLLCDTGNHRLRRVSAGVIATIAGIGVQGFSGDNAAAAEAELDSLTGVAVSGNGSIYIADTHNHRLRVINTNGIIQTFAGTGAAGYSGDAGPATAAQLSSPRSVTIDSAGDVIFSDSNNHRIRSINPQGTITTIAGSNWQGLAADGSVAIGSPLNTPRGVALSGFNAPVFADTPNHLVREVSANGNIYTIAIPQSPRSSIVTLAALPSITYGQGSATITVSGSVPTPQGTVTLLDNGVTTTTATLSAGATTISLASLNAGPHSLSSVYAGDGLNPASTSATTTLQVVQSASTTALQPIGQSSYAGLPLLLTATVSPAAAGNPTGEVDFLDDTTLAAKATLINGRAIGTYLAPAQGNHTVIAQYSGDANFLPSSSAAATVAIAAMPDFSLSASTTSQTVQGGLIATYPLLVSSQGGVFTGSVTLSVSGFQAGSTASFSPSLIVPGASGATVTMSIQTVPNTASSSPQPLPAKEPNNDSLALLLALPLLLSRSLRKKVLHRKINILPIILSLLLIGSLGCGARTLSSSTEGNKSYSLTITATSTNLAGTPIAHTTVVSLIVE